MARRASVVSTKRASAYLRKGTICLHSSSRTVAGAWIAAEPYLTIDSLDDEEGIAAAIRTALDASRQGVPHPTDLDALVSPLLELAGVRTWAGFVSGTRYCAISEEDGTIGIMPTVTRGRSSFEHLPDDTITLDGSEIQSIAKYLTKAYDRCRQA